MYYMIYDSENEYDPRGSSAPVLGGGGGQAIYMGYIHVYDHTSQTSLCTSHL